MSPPRHDPRPRHGATPADVAVLRLRAGSIPRAAGRSTARRALSGAVAGLVKSRSPRRRVAATTQGAAWAHFGGDLGEAGPAMTFTVTYKPSAEQELADVWINAPDRQAVTAAANRIDQFL